MDTHTALAKARSFLFVPGNRPERFEKAACSGADAVVLDLEDSVPLSEKARARESIANAWSSLQALQVPLVVRINPAEQAAGMDDLHWIGLLDQSAGIMVPKAESVSALQAVRGAAPGVPLLPLIESAAGYAALSAIAGTKGVLRLVLGHLDFMADTGLQCSEGEPELAPLRFAMAMATRAHQLAAAVDGVTVNIGDDARLRGDTRRALRFGFGGKLCIHPQQVKVVHDELAPTQADITWAQRVLEADAFSGGAAVQLDGRMVDMPVVLQARRVLERVVKP